MSEAATASGLQFGLRLAVNDTLRLSTPAWTMSSDFLSSLKPPGPFKVRPGLEKQMVLQDRRAAAPSGSSHGLSLAVFSGGAFHCIASLSLRAAVEPLI